VSAAHTARWPGAQFAVVVATLVCAAAPRTDPTDDGTVVFHLRDQFGRVHDAAALRGRALLVVAAARGGRAVGTAWVESLRAMRVDSGTAQSEAVAPLPVVAVADLRGVPWLLRRIVRAQFPDDARQPVLLDWDGSLARRLALDRDRCTVLLVDRGGRIVRRITPDAVDSVAARAIWQAGIDRAQVTAAQLTP
jgi:hypothetical protein